MKVTFGISLFFMLAICLTDLSSLFEINTDADEPTNAFTSSMKTFDNDDDEEKVWKSFEMYIKMVFY